MVNIEIQEIKNLKHLSLIFSIVLTATLAYSQAPNSWTQKADFEGTARYAAVSFSIEGKGYLGTGANVNNEYNYYKDFWEYNPVLNTWTQKADFGGTAREDAVGFSIGSKGYLGTGFDPNVGGKKDFWEYDPALNTWTQKADFGGAARAGAVGFSIGSKGYLGTGSFNNDFWEYDPSLNTWTQQADFGGTARVWAVGFSIGSKGYVGTGYHAGDIYYPYFEKDFWEYDPALNTWTQKADFGGTARAFAACFSISSKGYIGTGAGGYSGVDSNDFWQYDQALNTWTQKVDFGGSSRSSAVGFSIGSKGYLGMGYDDFSDNNKKDLWEYTPEEPVSTCSIPIVLATINISSTTATFKWLGISEALSYKLRYKTAGNSEWTFTKSINNYKTIQGLTPNTEYTWQVKSFCDIQPVVASDWSEKQFFTTDDLRLSVQTIDDFLLEVYPNPVSQSATLSFFLMEASPVIIELMDVNGRIFRVVAKNNFAAGNHEVTFNRESLIAGIYFLQLKTDEGVLMKKLVIE